jgi:hydrogenase maturation factor HypF (carbamoyltransferase family)
MQNRLLFESLTTALEADGFQVLAPQQVSPNDEGVALGQAWAAMLTE